VVASGASSSLRDGTLRSETAANELVATTQTFATVTNVGWISAAVAAVFTAFALGFGW
jgi:hypothetical protein